MATIVEKRNGQTIYRSPNTVDIPAVDLLTFLFGRWYKDKIHPLASFSIA